MLKTSTTQTQLTKIMKSPTHTEIANNYSLWMEYVDPSGIDSEEDFNAMSTEQKLETINACFGEK